MAREKKPAARTQHKKAEPHSEEKNGMLKRLEDFEQTRPIQLNFFELLAPEDKRFSNTIELYDFMPKYHWGKVERIGGKFLEVLEREFECRGASYKIKIKPASIEDKDGVERYHYPSKREELVEDALRKIAVEGHGLFLDDQAGVTFTLYQLQQELSSNGHTYSIREIKDSLFICAQTNLVVQTENGDSVLISSLFETVGLQTREDWKGQGEKTRAFVRFNSLVTESIKNGNFRQLNYEKSMAYKSVISRQLHKRMSHHYTQASIAHPYHIMLSTIIRDFGLTEYDRVSHNLRDVVKALNEMKEEEVLLNFKVEKIIDTNKRSKLTDAKLILTPHPKFAGEVIHANKRQGQLNKARNELR